MGDQITMMMFFIIVFVIVLYKLLWTGNYTRDIFLGPGFYTVGVEIPPGKGDLMAESGGGSFCIKEKGSTTWSLCNNIGITSGAQPSRFRNVYLNPGDTLEINGNVNIMITPPVPIRDVLSETLGPGNYRFGIDVPPAKYDIEVVGGDGQVYLFKVGEKDYTFYQDMAKDNPAKANKFANVICAKGYEMWIQGSLQIKLNPSGHQPLWI